MRAQLAVLARGLLVSALAIREREGEEWKERIRTEWRVMLVSANAKERKECERMGRDGKGWESVLTYRDKWQSGACSRPRSMNSD